ncbi:unnamed protein product [Malus baccata var. baccata]
MRAKEGEYGASICGVVIAVHVGTVRYLDGLRKQKQEEVIDHFVKQASSLDVTKVTSHPALFGFSEIIVVPNLEGTENYVYFDVLRLFAYGTWSDYKSKNAKVASSFGRVSNR